MVVQVIMQWSLQVKARDITDDVYKFSVVLATVGLAQARQEGLHLTEEGLKGFFNTTTPDNF